MAVEEGVTHILPLAMGDIEWRSWLVRSEKGEEERD
jgi:hypothetical protein